MYTTQIKELQDEISSLKERYNIDPRQDNDEELEKLREENKNLTTNLEDLDSQHQLAMERLLSLKKELQKNFEVLRQEHEDLKYNNDEYANEIKDLQGKLAEKNKDLETLKTAKADYDTLHHKYMNLERVHDLLRENAEKFQEENQELHEEIFKLQEQVTKLEHEVELVTKHSELSETVPRDRYDELLKELNDLKDSRNSNHQHVDEVNIDDNAKSVIETLKRELHEVKHRLAQKESDTQSDNKVIKTEKIMQFYNKYVNFEIPVDYLGEVPSSGENIVVFKLESVFKTLNSFKKDIDKLNHKLSEKKLNIDHMQTQIDDLTTENDFLTNDLHHTERELEEMKKNNDFLISEIAALKNTSKLEPIIETHEDNLAKLETELADSNKLNKNFESKIHRIEKELEAVKHEKVLLQSSLVDLKEKYALMLSELDMFKIKTKEVEELEKTVDIASEEMVKNCTHEIHELKKRLHAANAKNEQLSIDVHIAENDKVLLTQEMDHLRRSFERDQHSFSKSKDEHDGRLPEVVEDSLEPQARASSSTLLETSTSKNINNVLKEIEEIKIEKANIQAHLNIAKDENTLLKESVSQLNTAIDHIRQQEKHLLDQLEDLKKSRQEVIDNDQILKGTIENLIEKVAMHELVSKDVNKIKEENIHLTQTKVHLQAELLSTDSKITQLSQEFEKVLSNLSEKDSLIDALNTTVTENNNKVIQANETISELENNLVAKNNEILKLLKSLEDVTQELNQTNQQSDQRNEGVLRENESMNQELVELNVELKNKTDQISALKDMVAEVERNCSQFKTLADEKDKEIKELRQSIVEISDKLKNVDNTTNADDYAILLKEKEAIQNHVVDLQNNITAKEKELNEIKAKHDLMEKACIEYKTLVENATAEKTELINLVNLKHNESLQYHNEIQRLNHILLEQNAEMKKLIDEKNQQEINETCATCESLRMTLREKDEIIKNLNQNSSVFEKNKADLLNANESLRMLAEKCDGLEKNLQIQLENLKTLAAEKIQLSEQHENATRELERLRRHLVEMEDNYTQELMTSEQKLTECQASLRRVEERAKQSSTVYTSNSIRANQEVETLRNQIKLLEKQREEVQARLGDAEDARGRSEAALTNLQVVLEQFQLDKERDIHAATEKIRNKMEDLKKENGGLQKEIEKLNVKLQESLAGLQAATRLGDQLETKTAQINDLKEQVKTLQTSVGAAEERYYKAISNQQDKVDKNLVKNLVLNFVLTAGNNTNKTQILRVLSTVLDFNQQECRKLGLEKAPPTDSLAAEFVKFLQDESKPRAPLPSMLGLARSSTPSSRKSSTIGPSPVPSEVVGHKRNPSTGSNNLLFQNIDNVETTSQISIESDHRVSTSMDTGVNQTRNTEGAILKHVLKDM
ncbi:thyroid receptor-interacting protein 11-like isoform X2 [Leguminivora glycinivorella]|nr:thyroid receptor-interacting protein 11-like isoform X2 [Leguminivora glycinivorella]